MNKNKIVFEVEKINTLLIRKVDIHSNSEEEEFIMNIYRQFGFRDFKEIKKWTEEFSSKPENEGKLWMQEFYMSMNAEADLLINFLKFYNRSLHRILTMKYNEVSLNYGARNNKINKSSNEGEVKKD
jgi:hypothetical protein